MPRKKNPAQNTALGTPEIVNDAPLRAPVVRLVMEERQKLLLIFNDPVFVKAWRNAQAMKPSVFLSSTALAGEFGDKSASNRLHEMRGWEMFQAALIRQSQEEVVRPKAPTETFPSDGTIEQETLRTMPVKPAPRQVPGQPINITPKTTNP